MLAGMDQENSALVGDSRMTVGLTGGSGVVAANSWTTAVPVVASDNSVTTWTLYVVPFDSPVKT